MALSTPAIINLLDYGTTWSDPGSGALNAGNLKQAISDAQAACNGLPTNLRYAAIIVFPGNNVWPPMSGGTGFGVGNKYYFNEQSPGIGYAVQISCPNSILFVGTGSTELIMQDSADLFQITANTDDQTIGGMTFQDFQMNYSAGLSGSVAAVHVTNGCQNVRLVRVTLSDCPIGAWFESALQCSMLECTSVYATSSAATCVQIGNNSGASAKEVFIAGCLFRSTNFGNTGILIQGTEHTRVINTRIEAFGNGILIEPGPSGVNALRCFFSDVTVYAGPTSEGSPLVAGAAVVVQPQSTTGEPSAQQVGQVSFVNCLFEPGDSMTSSSGAGVVIDNNGSTIDGIRFVSCYSCRWTGPGLLINYSGGAGEITNTEILGGMYAGNNSKDNSGTQAYGIAVIGDKIRGVRIVGVSCVGTYNFVTLNNSKSSPQQSIGIYIDQGAEDVIVDSCDVRKNSTNGVYINGESATVTTDIFVRNCNASGISPYTSAISVNGDVSNVQVTNCAGYNDQYPILATTAPSSSPISGLTYDYYGPVCVYGNGALSLTVSFGTPPRSTGQGNGTFPLGPAQSLEYAIGLGHIWTTFLVVGQ